MRHCEHKPTNTTHIGIRKREIAHRGEHRHVPRYHEAALVSDAAHFWNPNSAATPRACPPYYATGGSSSQANHPTGLSSHTIMEPHSIRSYQMYIGISNPANPKNAALPFRLVCRRAFLVHRDWMAYYFVYKGVVGEGGAVVGREER